MAEVVEGYVEVSPKLRLHLPEKWRLLADCESVQSGDMVMKVELRNKAKWRPATEGNYHRTASDFFAVVRRIRP